MVGSGRQHWQAEAETQWVNRDGAEWDEARTDGPHALSVRRTLPLLAPSTILAQSVLAHVVRRRLALAVLAVIGAVVALEPSVVVVMALRLLALTARGEVVDEAVVRVEEGALAECLEADDVYADAVGVVCGRGREVVQLVGMRRVGRVMVVGSGPGVVLLTRGEKGGVNGVVLLVAHLSDKILGRVQVQVADRSNLLLQEEEDWNQQSDSNQPPILNSLSPLAHLSLFDSSLSLFSACSLTLPRMQTVYSSLDALEALATDSKSGKTLQQELSRLHAVLATAPSGPQARQELKQAKHSVDQVRVFFCFVMLLSLAHLHHLFPQTGHKGLPQGHHPARISHRQGTPSSTPSLCSCTPSRHRPE